MKSIIKFSMAFAAVSVLVGGCKKDETPTPPSPTDPYAEFVKIAEMPILGAGVKATLYMDEDPFMGYNILYVVLKDSITNVLVEDADVTFEPVMDMGTMVHSAPWEPAIWNADIKAFKGAATFIMIGNWSIKIKVHNNVNDHDGVGETPFTVIAKTEAQLFSFTNTADGLKYFVALVNPKSPKVGLNDFEVAVYKKQEMMLFPAVDGLNIAIDPQMPSMGHGSPNNVNPAFTANGHYKGVVNFTMTGYWEVNLTIKDAANILMYDAGFFGMTL